MQPIPAFMQLAIDLATRNVADGGGPFGAVIVRHGELLATGVNRVTANNDPTAHAEITAIRAACAALSTFELRACHIYTSCEPCPMCLAAIYWSRCSHIFFGNTAADAADVGFDDAFLYRELQFPIEGRSIPTHRLLGEEAIVSFQAWTRHEARTHY